MTERSHDDGAPGSSGRPPRRLIEAGPAADSEAFGIGLLREAEPTRPSAFRKQRIRAALGQTLLRRAPFGLRPAIIAGVLGGAAVASAALGHWPGWVHSTYRHLVAPAATTETVAARLARPTNATPLAMVVETPLATTQPALAEVAPSPAEPPPLVRARAMGTRRTESRIHQRPRASASHVDRDPSTAPAPAAAGKEPAAASAHPSGPAAPVRNAEDMSALSQAMRALRVDRDPLRARALARQYLERYPKGAVAEEALALVVEAAAAHQDADAAALGARYLRLYPTGAFRVRAQRAIDAAP